MVIPVFGVSQRQLLDCVESVDSALGAADELIVVFDGPPAYDAERLQFPAKTQVVINARRLGLVANWNHCLRLASNRAVHLMHADDRVDTRFYTAVREAFTAAPTCAFAVAAGSPGRVAYLPPEPAVRVLLSRMRPAVGSVVYFRSSSAEGTCFSPEYPYCPDEEMLPRLAMKGGIAMVGTDLYRESAWPGQTRHSTWREPDFVDIYWKARMHGVEACSTSVRAFARRETRWAIVSVCAELIRASQLSIVRNHLRALRRLDPGASRSPRVVAAEVLATTRLGPPILKMVDRVRGRQA